MNAITLSTTRLDRIAMGLSGLCLVHCVGTTVLLALLSAAGGVLGAPIIHEVGLSLAMVMGAIALGRGILEHVYSMPSAGPLNDSAFVLPGSMRARASDLKAILPNIKRGQSVYFY